MKHPPHRMSQYADGNVWVEFCTVCSAEGKQLSSPCPGEYVEINNPSNFLIDTDKEQS